MKKTRLSEEFTFSAFREHHGGAAIVLFVLDRNEKVQVVSIDQKLNPQPRDILFYLSIPYN